MAGGAVVVVLGAYGVSTCGGGGRGMRPESTGCANCGCGYMSTLCKAMLELRAAYPFVDIECWAPEGCLVILDEVKG